MSLAAENTSIEDFFDRVHSLHFVVKSEYRFMASDYSKTIREWTSEASWKELSIIIQKYTKPKSFSSKNVISNLKNNWSLSKRL